MMDDVRPLLASQAKPRGTLLILALAALGSACGPAAEDGGEEGHDHAEHAEHAAEGAEEEHDEHGALEQGHAEPKTDAHHVAEGRTDCEDDVELQPEALARYGIEVAPALERALAPTISAPGHLAFRQGGVARVGSPVTGRIVDVRAHVGDSVAEGDVLLVIESPELGEAQSDYLQKRTVASTAGPTLELARTSYARAKELHERIQGIALTDVQAREVELRQAERDQEIARSAEAAALNRLRLFGLSEESLRELERTGKVEPGFPIAAPIRGRIVDVKPTLGELVDPGQDLIVVGDLSLLSAIAEVSEMQLAEVAVGARTRVRIPALPQARCEGRVTALSPMLEPSTRTAEVLIEVENPDGTMLPGMFLQVEIESSRGNGAPALAVPDGAVMAVEGRPTVFVPLLAGGSVFCKHEIEVGAPVGDYIPVLAGLVPGELVVVAGAFRLKAEHGKASAQHEH